MSSSDDDTILRFFIFVIFSGAKKRTSRGNSPTVLRSVNLAQHFKMNLQTCLVLSLFLKTDLPVTPPATLIT